MAREVTATEKKQITAQVGICRDKIQVCEVVTTEAKKKKKGKSELILVLGKHRIYVFKKGAKAFKHAHFLDLAEIISFSSKEIELRIRTFDKPLLAESERADSIIRTIISTFKKRFSAIGLPFQLQVLPKERLDTILSTIPDPVVGECGGFNKAYKSVCNYMGLPWRIDICWDVMNILGPHECREFNLREYNFANIGDFRSCIATLRYNRWFTTFSCENRKLPKDALVAIADMLRYNTQIEYVKLPGIGATSSTFSLIAESALSNKRSSVKYLDFSNNAIEDKGAVALAKWIAGTSVGLIHLNIKNCGINKKGGTAIFEALEHNEAHHSTLSKLYVGKNKLDVESSISLGNALKHLQHLSMLDISCMTGVKWEPILNSLKKQNTLQVLNLSENKLQMKKKDAIFAEWYDFFHTCSSIKEMDVSKATFQLDIVLDLISASKAVQKWDFTDSELEDKGMLAIVDHFQTTHKHVKHLILDKNFEQGKSKIREKLVASLISLINASECKVDTLSIAAGGNSYAIKQEIIPFLNAIGVNNSLLFLDVSGHLFGDEGALAIAKSLQKNKKLTHLRMDGNDLSASGFKSLETALTRNDTLYDLSVPTHDITSIVKNEIPIQDLIDNITKALLRNRAYAVDYPISTKLFTPEQREDMIALIERIEKLMGTHSKTRRTNEELENQIKFLVGEEFLSKIHQQANENSGKFLFDKLCVQLEGIVMLSTMETSTKVAEPSNSKEIYRQSSMFKSPIPPPQQTSEDALSDLRGMANDLPSFSLDSNDDILGTGTSGESFYKPLPKDMFANVSASMYQWDEDQIPTKPPLSVAYDELPPEGKALADLAHLAPGESWSSDDEDD